MTKAFVTIAAITTLMVSSKLPAQTGANLSGPYEFKAARLGMSLDEFKQKMSAGKITVRVATPGVFANAMWNRNKTKEVDTPVCTDVPGNGPMLASGMKLPKLLEAMKNGVVMCNPSPKVENINGNDAKLEPFLTVAGYNLNECVYYFYNGKLYEIEMSIYSMFFDNLIDAFSQKYGTPKAMSSTAYENVYGAHVAGKNFAWQRGSQSIIAIEGSGNGPTEAGVMPGGFSFVRISDSTLGPPADAAKPLDF